jgi:hypothetical protein|tara:strand:+ start:521 stop:1123 length:603 start_codon:yes stop_codon:yes gene_type:complete
MPLPIGTEPLVLADGTKINPLDGKILKDDILVEVPNTREIQRDIVAARKRIADLPLPPEQMNTLSLVMAYTVFGLSDKDIASVLSISENQVHNIKMNNVYNELQQNLVQSIIHSDATEVRDLFVLNSKTSAQLFIDTVKDPEMGIGTRLSAANNILDRAGHRPADIVEHRHKVEGGLRIEYVKKEEQDIPTIDVTPEGVM